MSVKLSSSDFFKKIFQNKGYCVVNYFDGVTNKMLLLELNIIAGLVM